MSNDAALLRELQRLATAVERNTELLQVIADDVAEIATRARLSLDDLRLLSTVLPAVAETTRGAAFAASEILDIPTLAAAVDGHSAASLAWLLSRARGRRISRHRVEDAGRDRTGRLWAVTTT